MRAAFAGLLLLAAAAGPAAAADAPAALTAQTLEARLADAEKRAAFEAGERERLALAVEELRARVSALTEGADTLRRRGEELDRSRGACQDREEALRADLDVCDRSRLRLEDEKGRCGAQVSAHAGELAERDRLVEECRGRAANLEAQNTLLAAEKQGAERESREKADELRYTYDDLVASLRKELATYQERERGDAAEQSRGVARAAELSDGLKEALRDELEKGRVAVSVDGERVAVRLKVAGLYVKSGELSPSARAALTEFAKVVIAAGDRAVLVEDAAPAPIKAPKGKGAAAARPDALPNGPRVAAFLLGAEGLDRDRLALSPALPSRGAEAGGPAVILHVVPAAPFETFFGGAAPPRTPQ